MCSRASTTIVGHLRLVRAGQRMKPRPLRCPFVQSIDVGVQLPLIDPPHPPSPELHGRELAGADQRVNLSHADAEVGRDVLEREKARLDPGSPPAAVSVSGARAHNRNDSTDMGRGPVSTAVCVRLPVHTCGRIAHAAVACSRPRSATA
jgi:hypothetical protein